MCTRRICRQSINISSKYNENVCSLQVSYIAFALDGTYISNILDSCGLEVFLARKGIKMIENYVEALGIGRLLIAQLQRIISTLNVDDPL